MSEQIQINPSYTTKRSLIVN